MGAIALFLGLGAVTTVAVAWGLAMWLAHDRVWAASSSVPVDGIDDGSYYLHTWEAGRAGMRRRQWEFGGRGDGLVFGTRRAAPAGHRVRPGPRWSRLVDPRFVTPEVDWEFEDARGWPALAMWCRIYGPVRTAPAYEVRDWEVSGGMLLAQPKSGSVTLALRALPMRPLWGGFVLNTFLYAPAWAAAAVAVRGALAGWKRVRGRRWSGQGRCGACGYMCRGLERCPECGSS